MQKTIMDKINIEENELKKLFDMIGLKKKMFFAFHASRELTVRISMSFYTQFTL
jgi:hypothetical protein